jgi:hypothetical protein
LNQYRAKAHTPRSLAVKFEFRINEHLPVFGSKDKTGASLARRSVRARKPAACRCG